MISHLRHSLPKVVLHFYTWEEITCIELLGMFQGKDTFWNFAVVVQVKNRLLKGTESYLDTEKLCHQIESGTNPRLIINAGVRSVTGGHQMGR